ncbi:GGDEF domain-containing protein [Sorangium sp. So ce295]|uniref:diguanylate cyclase n=1 Tax=Sorangium sp. So ce295 TaxID=3133295 RepID=UPI003F5FBD1C
MAIDQSTVQELLERIRDATYKEFPHVCGDLYEYLDTNVSENSAYRAFEADRKAKWSTWGPTRFRAWEMPKSKDERISLAYDMFRSVAEQGDQGDGLLYRMYVQNFPGNVDKFREDFLKYLVDALNRIGSAEPATTRADDGRKKDQKFGILDAPNLLGADLASASGLMGRSLIYFDIDGFKAVNSKYTEVMVDRDLLPALQRLVVAAVTGIGYAYAEGGDEMVVLLQNANLTMGAAFADALRQLISDKQFLVNEEPVTLAASFGVAAEPYAESAASGALKEAANRAKKFAKESGKNCVAIWVGDAAELWTDEIAKRRHHSSE